MSSQTQAVPTAPAEMHLDFDVAGSSLDDNHSSKPQPDRHQHQHQLHHPRSAKQERGGRRGKQSRSQGCMH
jgi:hypothetical protein